MGIVRTLSQPTAPLEESTSILTLTGFGLDPKMGDRVTKAAIPMTTTTTPRAMRYPRLMPQRVASMGVKFYLSEQPIDLDGVRLEEEEPRI